MNKIKDNLIELVEYNWADERKNFEESFDTNISSQDTLEEWIEICESDKYMMNHIFYHLMKIKQYLINKSLITVITP